MSVDNRNAYQGITLEASRRFSYGSCDGHRMFLSKQLARDGARVHQRRTLPCLKCDRGMTPEPFRCPINPRLNPRHWHFGHRWRSRDQQPPESD